MKKRPVTLTERDKAVLGDLRQYGLHSSRRLAAAHFPGVQHPTVLRRLRALEAAHYIQKVPDLDGIGAAWGLDKAGGRFFEEQPAKIHFPRSIQEHDLKLTALRIRLEEAGLARSWRPEHEIRAHVAARCGRAHVQDKNIPDGLMGVEAKGFREAVAVELELTQKNQDRYRRIFRDYFAKEKLWGFWYVTGSPTIGKQLQTSHENTHCKRGEPYFFWSLLEEVMADPLKAPIHGAEGTFRVGEIWAAESPTPVQGMGIQAAEPEAPAPKLSTENEKQIAFQF